MKNFFFLLLTLTSFTFLKAQSVHTLSGATIIGSAQDNTLTLASSETGFNYFLRNNADGTIIGSSKRGTGGALTFQTGAISETTSYYAFAAYTSWAFKFNGEGDGGWGSGGDRIALEPTAASMFTSGLTVEAWINPADFTRSRYSDILRKNNTHGGRILLGFQEFGTVLSFGIDTAEEGYQELDIPIVTDDYLDQWMHILAYYDDATNTVKVYRDGVEIGSASRDGALTPSSVAVEAFIGGTEPFIGKVASLRLWDKALTSTEERAYAQSNLLTGNEPGLVAYYPFVDLSVRQLDYSVNNSRGTVLARSDSYAITKFWTDGITGGVGKVASNVKTILVDGADPIFTSLTTANFLENGSGTAYTAVATDANSITYNLGSTNDEALFNIDGSTGAVTFKSVPDFETPVDADTDNAYVIEISANDGLNNTTQTVTITITNIDEIVPVFTSSVTANFAENGTGTAYTAVATDDNSITYSLGSTNDEALFDIDGSTGAVTFKSSPDFETPSDGNTDNTYVILVNANDGVNNTTQTVIITVTNGNDIIPVFTSPVTANFEENGTGTAYMAVATGEVSITYSLGSSNDEALFNIDGSTGAVTFKSVPDFEAPADGNTDNDYVILVNANVGILNVEQTVTITVTNANDAPIFTATPISTVSENDIYSYLITTTDGDGDAVSMVGTTLPTWLSALPGSTVTTFAGSSETGAANGTGTSATFDKPTGMALDAAGNIYLTDQNNHLIRKITPSGVVTTFAGSGTPGFVNGTGTMAAFDNPRGIAIDGSGNFYVSEMGNHTIRKITPAGVVSTVTGTGLGGSATPSTLANPYGIAIGPDGNIYLADQGNNQIRKVTPQGVVSTFATGVFQPKGIVFDNFGNAFVTAGNVVNKITPAGVLTTFAGMAERWSHVDGIGTSAWFNSPTGITIDAAGNLYVSDQGFSHTIRKITPSAVVTTVAGRGPGGIADGVGTAATFFKPGQMVIDASGDLYISDEANFLIRKMNIAPILSGNAAGQEGSHAVSLTASDGNGGTATQNFNITVTDGITPVFTSVSTASFVENGTGTAYTAVATDANSITYSLGSTNDEALFNIEGSTGAVTFKSAPDFEVPADSNTDNDHVILVNANDGFNNSTLTVTISVTNINDAPIFTSTAITTVNDNEIYNYTITTSDVDGDAASVAGPTLPAWLSVLPENTVTTFAGSGAAGAVNGTGTSATFSFPNAIVLDGAGNAYVTDQENHLIRKITPTGVVSTFVGSGAEGFVNGTGTLASFNRPRGIAIDASGNLYVIDWFNNAVRKITPEGAVSTLIDITGWNSTGIVAGPGDNIYLGHLSHDKIHKVTPQGVVSTFATGITNPKGIVFDSSGNAYVTSAGVNTVSKITPAGVVSVFAGSGALASTDGTGTSAAFLDPYGITIDAFGNLYVSEDIGGNRIRKITPAAVVSTIAGTGAAGFADGVGTAAVLNRPGLLGIDASGYLYIPDVLNQRIRKLNTTLMLSGNAVGQEGVHAVSLTASDGNGGTATQNFNITVSDGTGPVFTSASTASFVENETGTAYTAGATDANSFTYNLGSSNDEALFDIDGITGVVTFKSTPDFESPSDVNTDNDYVILVNANDGSNNSALTVTITVTNANEAPIFTSTAITTVNDNEIYDYTITTSDEDGDVVSVTGTTLPTWLSVLENPVTTFAGSGAAGAVNGTGTSTTFSFPNAIVLDAAGNAYVTDQENHLIRKITPTGVVSTLAGSGAQGFVNGTGSLASFNRPRGIAIDGSGNLYVLDWFNHALRKITPAGEVSTLVDVTGWNPTGIVAGPGDNIYVADHSNLLIRKVTPQGVVSTFATGVTQARGIVFDSTGNAYVTSYTNLIYKITPTGVLSTFAGSGNSASTDGTGTSASFLNPYGITIDALGNLYVSEDAGSHRIRKITPAAVVSTIAGTGVTGFADGAGTAAVFSTPGLLGMDASGYLYIPDVINNRIRKLNTAPILSGNAAGQEGVHAVSLTASDGNGGTATQNFNITVSDGTDPVFTSPVTASFVENGTGMAYTAVATDANSITYSLGSSNDEALFDIDGSTGAVTFKSAPDFEAPTDGNTDNDYVILVNANDGSNNSALIVTIAVTNINEATVFTSTAITTVNDNEIYNYTITTSDEDGDAVSVTGTTLPTWLSVLENPVTTFAGSGAAGAVNGTGTSATFSFPNAIVLDAAGNAYVTDQENHLIRKITPAGVVSTLAGSGAQGFVNGTGSLASFNRPRGIAIDGSGNLYVLDWFNHALRKITPAGEVSTLVDVTGWNPTGIVAGPGDNIYVADHSNLLIRKVTPQGVVSTFATGVTQARGIVFDSMGNAYVTSFTNLIYKITPTGVLSTFAGSGDSASTDGTGTSAAFLNPSGITIDALGNLYVSEDAGSQRIRKITPAAVVSTIAGTGVVGFVEGVGTAAVFNTPGLLGMDASGYLYIPDVINNRIRKLNTVPILSGNAAGQAGVHAVGLTASDGNGGTATQNFNITISDVTTPVFTSLTAASFVENGTGTTYTAVATDANALTYSLGAGNDEALFDIASGAVTFKTSPDFEAPTDGNTDNAYVINVIASDGINSVNQDVTITVTNVDDTAPVITSLTTVNFAENGTGTAYTVTGTDGNALTYNLGAGNDEALFDIASGVVTFKTSPDFETPGDADANNTYVINVIASDGINAANQDVTITVTNVDDTDPVITSAITETFAENGTGTAYTVTGTDANALTYSLGAGNDEALFDIASGVVTFKTSPDFETPVDDNIDNVYVINVIASDGINSVNQDVAITVTNVDDTDPVITSAITETFAENGTGTAYTVTGTDANALTYSLGAGNDEALFDIAAGVVTFKTSPDFEVPTDGNTDNAYVINVIASDGINAANQDVTITVTNVDDTAPIFTSLATASFAENSSASVYTAIATDANALTYSLGSSNDEALFNISSGVITFKSAPDFEVPADGNTDNAYVINVVASDGINSVNKDVTITVTNVDDTAPVITSDLTETFAENGTGTAYTVAATDANALTYSLGTGNDEALFDIASDVVTFKTSPDFEAPTDGNSDNAYVINVIANDGINSVSQDVTITVTNVDDTAPVITSDLTETFAENGTGTAYTVTGIDANELTYSLGAGNDEALFDIASGVVTFKTSPDFETPVDGNTDNAYVINVIASDGINSVNEDVTITVTNVDDTAPVITSAITETFAENGIGTAYTVTGTDANELIYSFGAGNDEALFDIAEGVVTFKTSPDFEAPTDGNTDNAYVINVIANDCINSVNKDVTITVTNVEEDLTAPAKPVITSITDDTGSSNSDGVTNDSNIIISGTAEALSSLEVFTQYGSIRTTQTDANGDWSLDITDISLVELTFNLTAKATDLAGNSSVTSDVFVLTADRTAPAKPVITSITDDTGSSNGDGVTNDSNIIISGTAEALSSVAVFTQYGSIRTTQTDANGDWSLDITDISLVELSFNLTAKARDLAGNSSAASDVFVLTADYTAPSKPVITSITDDTGSSNSDGVTNDANIIVSGTAEALANVEVFTQYGSIRTTPTDANGDWSLDITDISLVELSFNLTAKATDLAGNGSAASDVFALTADRTAPAKPVITSITDDTGSSNSDGVTNDANIIISGTAEALSSVEMFTQYGAVRTTQTDANGDWSLDITDITLVELSFNLTAKATDLAGNTSATSDIFVLKPDYTAPAKPVITGITDDTGSSNSDGVTNDANIIISGTAEALSSVEVFTQYGSIRITQTDANGDWSLDITDISLVELKFNLTVKATDLAGNTSAASDVFVLTADRTAPAKPVITSITDDTGSSNSDGVTNDANIIISGTAEALSSVEVYTQYGSIRTTQAAANGDWALDITDITLVELSFNLTAKATDLAGNLSAASDVFALKVDYTSPTVVLTAPSAPTASDFVVTAQFSEDVTDFTLSDITVTSGTATNLAAVNANTYTFSVASGNASADVSIAVSLVSDIAGNANVGSNILNLDFTAPPVLSSPDNSLTDFINSVDIKTYPNPVSEVLNVDLSGFKGAEVDIRLVNAAGTPVFTKEAFTGSSLRLNVSGYTNGLYIMQFYDGTKMIRKKVLVKK